MLALDNPAYSREMQRLAGEPKPPEYVAWVRRYGPAITDAWENAPPDLDAKDYDALHAAADAVARAEERGYREGWM